MMSCRDGAGGEGIKGKGQVERKEMDDSRVQTESVRRCLTAERRWREHAAVNPLRLITQLLGDQQPASIHPTLLPLLLSFSISFQFITVASSSLLNCDRKMLHFLAKSICNINIFNVFVRMCICRTDRWCWVYVSV